MAKVEVDEKEYKALVEAAKRLEALETIGVDNWEGYSDAMALLREEEA